MAKKTDTRSYFDKDLKLLWGLAAARCACKKCRVECVAEGTAKDRAAIFGKIAHIVAHSDTGPRADPSYPKKLRDKYENLILLCGNHHDIVDVQENTYTVGRPAGLESGTRAVGKNISRAGDTVSRLRGARGRGKGIA